jgi:transcriptional regulator with XRE-family HTH domain
MPHNALQQRIRWVERWGDTFPPACACGCGEHVHFTNKGPTTYVNRQHVLWAKDYKSMSTKGNAAQLDGAIPIDKFRSAVYDIKKKKNLTFTQLANAGGMQHGQLSMIMFGDNEYIKRETAEGFLRRVAGLSARPSGWQQRQAQKLVARDDRARRETDAEGLPRWKLH